MPLKNQNAMGLDDREVIADAPQKSIGRETTLVKDTFDKNLLNDTLVLLADDISYRLYAKGMWARTITLKIKFSDLKSITRSRSGEPVRKSEDILKIAADILNSVTLEKPVRLIGISASNLTSSAYVQLSFDEAQEKPSDILSDTIFKLKQEFGRNALKTAKEMEVESKTDFNL